MNPFTPEGFRAARRALGLSQAQMAEALGVKSDRTIRRWENVRRPHPIPRAASLVVRHMLEVGASKFENECS